ncbi:MAG: FtsX-like permease family protein [Pseudomonadota bacterium]
MPIKTLLKSLMRRKFITVLLICQLAMTMGILHNSSILTLDVYNLLNQKKGMDASEFLVIEQLSLAQHLRDGSSHAEFTEQQDIEAIRHIDGVISVAAYNQIPLTHGSPNANIQLEDTPPEKDSRDLNYISYVEMHANGLTNLGIELLEGRQFTDSDEVTSNSHMKHSNMTDSIIVTESLAKRLSPDISILGQLTNRGRVIGVSQDIMYTARSQGRTKYYAYFIVKPTTDRYERKFYIVRSKPALIPEIEKKLRADRFKDSPERIIVRIASLQDIHENFFSRETGSVKMFITLCVLMLLVAIISSFAHAHFHVSKQIRLIGIRRALGAKKSDILKYVFIENILVSAIALLPGILCSYLINIQLSQFLTISKPNFDDFFAIYTVIVLSGFIATWLPAYRTAQIPPITATKTL